MPVILDNTTDAVQTWLDPHRTEWNSELKSLLKPYQGELDCYAVSKDVGKVGNDSPTFIIPVASSENKNNIANFFTSAKKPKKEVDGTAAIKDEIIDDKSQPTNIESTETDERATVDQNRSEDNAPMPVPLDVVTGEKRKASDSLSSSPAKRPAKAADVSKRVPMDTPASRKLRSATTNNTTPSKSPRKANDGSQKITSFFAK